jgi:hypothetical protein
MTGNGRKRSTSASNHQSPHPENRPSRSLERPVEAENLNRKISLTNTRPLCQLISQLLFTFRSKSTPISAYAFAQQPVSVRSTRPRVYTGHTQTCEGAWLRDDRKTRRGYRHRRQCRKPGMTLPRPCTRSYIGWHWAKCASSAGTTLCNRLHW